MILGRKLVRPDNRLLVAGCVVPGVLKMKVAKHAGLIDPNRVKALLGVARNPRLYPGHGAHEGIPAIRWSPFK